MDLMGGMASPLKPTTTDHANFPPSASEPNFRSSQPTASSWSIFTSTSTTSSAGHKGQDDIWAKSTRSQQPKPYDPFSEFGNLGGLGSSTTAKPQDTSSKPGPHAKAPSGKMPSSPLTSRPTYQMYGQRTANLGVSTPGSGSRSGSASPAGRSPSPAHHPNYTISSNNGRDAKSKYGMW